MKVLTAKDRCAVDMQVVFPWVLVGVQVQGVLRQTGGGDLVADYEA